MKLSLLSLLVCLSLPLLSLADQCSSIPPSLWCGNTEVERKCGFEKLCSRYRSATWNKPVEVTLLMEGLCPGCQAFIIDVLYPKIFKNFGSFVNIEIVPFGNAKMANGSIVCQHGSEECQINRFESCLIDSVEKQEQYMPLIFCVESQLKAGVTFDLVTEKCFRRLSVDAGTQRMIQSCMVSSLGARLQEKAAARTAAIWPVKHDHVPWVLINNVSLNSVQSLVDQLPALICQWYHGDKEIPFCKGEQKKKLLEGSLLFWVTSLQLMCINVSHA